ncbi:MAG TPA: bifunctional tetrahydrofolate synthase/dihydrofolate synthase [Burkholderiaceae bacterium]|nr:bifunctional tetrahydrofolate synthase/dihydrofolate synthase [Burkholderiaceae bacterium]
MIMSAPDTHASLPQWLAYLENLHHTEIDLGLDRVRDVAQRLGLRYPFTVITVGGTNGKGSVCAMLDAILLAGGYKVGTYASPHLVDFNERIRINGEFATDDDIVAQFARIEAARGATSLTYFEFATLAALLLFELNKVDVAVLEVGLGGRLDAVNIVDSDCAIVTSVDIDHSNFLGTTREQIGLEKAHIFRPGRPAICADPQPPASLIEHAAAIDADLWRFGRDFNYTGDRQQWNYRGRSQRRNALAYPALRGANQLLNASAVLAALEALRDKLVVPQQAVRLGFSHAALPGRFQILPGQPVTILDVAHNPHAAAALAQNLLSMPGGGNTYGVVGMLRDKDAIGTLSHLTPIVDHWLCAGLSGFRALSAHELAKVVDQALRSSARAVATAPAPTGLNGAGHAAVAGGAHSPSDDRKPGVRPVMPQTSVKTQASIHEFSDPVAAFHAARERASVNDRILVFGSFATVGPVLAEVGRTRT